MPSSSTRRATLTARFKRLEGDVDELRSAFRKLEARLGGSPLGTNTGISPHSQSQSQHLDDDGSPELHNGEDESDLDSSEFSVEPPGHWQQLFDNGLLGSDGDGLQRHQAGAHTAQKCSVLRALLPTRAKMLGIIATGALWLPLYNSFIPILNFARSSDELLAQYDQLYESEADPFALASLLLTIAIIVQHAPNDIADQTEGTVKDTSSFVKDVSDRVERTVVADDNLACTMEGIEVSLLFIRL